MNYSPATSDLPGMAKVLVHCLIEAGITDPALVSVAAKKIGIKYENWPSTALFINTAAAERKPDVKQLEHQRNETADNEGLKKLRALRDSLGVVKKFDGKRERINRETGEVTEAPARKEQYDFTAEQEAECRQRFIDGGKGAQREYIESLIQNNNRG